jgi:hypothetical protein
MGSAWYLKFPGFRRVPTLIFPWKVAMKFARARAQELGDTHQEMEMSNPETWGPGDLKQVTVGVPQVIRDYKSALLKSSM